jgi:hypothetical protein
MLLTYKALVQSHFSRAVSTAVFLIAAIQVQPVHLFGQAPPKTAPAAQDSWTQRHHKPVFGDPGYLPPTGASAPTSPAVPQFKGNVTVFEPLPNGVYQALARQTNCSLDLISFAGSQLTLVDRTTGYQDELHRLAQLTTVPDRFPGGCIDPVLGETAHFGTLLGKASNGDYIGAIGQLNGTETAITTYVYHTESQTFETHQNAVGNDAGSISVYDFNGDGILDMVVPYGNGSTGGVAVLLSNADGTFKAAVKYALPFFPASLVLNDFNGDGKADIAAVGSTAAGKPEIGVLLNKGNGTFGAAKITSAPYYAYWMVSADFNGDKKADLALSNGSLLFGNGDGTFTAAPNPWNANAPFPAEFNGLVARDFNHDGNIDLAAVSSVGESVVILLGNGKGQFGLKATYSSIFGAFTIGSSDLDGDGNLDLVLGEYGGGGFSMGVNSLGAFQVLMGKGDGTFESAALYPRAGMVQTAGLSSFAVGDFNGDGKIDLLGQRITLKDAIITGNPSLVVLKGDGAGDFTAGTPSPLQTQSEYDLQAADLRGDGKLDALTIDNSSSTESPLAMHVYLGNGDGTFQAGTAYALPGAPANFAVGDINGDGKPDVVVLIDSENAFGLTIPGKPGLYELINKGDGTFDAPKLIDGKMTAGSKVVLADLGNGKMDIVVQENGTSYSTPPAAGGVLVYLGKGGGAFEAGVKYLADTYGGGALAVADVRGKGKMDIVTTTAVLSKGFLTGSDVTVLPNNGNGTFGAPIKTAQAEQVPFLTDLAVADFNGDGKLDVALGSCCGSANTYLLLGNGDGTFQAPAALGVGGSSTSLTAVDITGTKYPDLIVASSANTISTDIVVLMNLYGANLTATSTVRSAPAATTPASGAAQSNTPGGSAPDAAPVHTGRAMF